MLAGHLLVAVIVGMFTAGLSWWAGFPGWAVLGCFVLGSNVAMIANAAPAIISGCVQARHARRSSGRQRRTRLGSLALVLLCLLALLWSVAC